MQYIVEYDDMVFQLDMISLKAKIVNFGMQKENVFIPRSIIFYSQEYIIDAIDLEQPSINYTVKSISFAKDSKLNEINLLCSLKMLKSLEIPASVKRLGNDWCKNLNNLNHILLSPQNKYFSYLDQKVLISKLDEKSENYDFLVFVRRDAQEVKIPSFIKQICCYSCSHCSNLSKIEFLENSELLQICDHAFESTSISKITIPKSVFILGNFVFYKCKKLNAVEFEKHSKLIIIGRTFAKSQIRTIKLPSNLMNLKFGTFSECTSLRKVEFEKNSNLKTIGTFSFAGSGIQSLEFPSRLEKLERRWCFDSSFLTSVIISPENKFFSFIDTKLIGRKSDPEKNVFDDLVFALRDIKSVTIPSYVRRIKSCTFSDCVHLKKVEFTDDSQLFSIGKESFSGCGLKSLLIPRKVCKIKKEAFICAEIETVEILGDDVMLGIDCFNSSDLRLISFPNAQKVLFYDDSFIFSSEPFQMFISPGGIIVIKNCRVSK